VSRIAVCPAFYVISSERLVGIDQKNISVSIASEVHQRELSGWRTAWGRYLDVDF
jgi:hypothetical protein